MDIATASDECDAVLDEIAGTVVADRRFLENVLLAILARGNVLIEDVPGTGKTLTSQSFARALGITFSRIQFTPDLLPADITGTHVFNERDQTFEFREGPVFENIVLGDEINRASPKTQAALLEAMAENQVTVEGETRSLPDPFFVIATQNPIEQEGTFPLPEAQVDRFLVKTSLGYPDRGGEVSLLGRRLSRTESVPSVDQVLSVERVRELQRVPEAVHVEDDVVEYIADVARQTRVESRVEVGVSPRGTQRLLETARANAVLQNREFVIPDDVKRVAHPVLGHRLVLTPEASYDEVDSEVIVDDILAEITVPTLTAAE